jgi:DNA polymerase-3 subunit epsilon
VILVDVETTGLLAPDTQDPERQPGIVQVAALKLERRELAGPFTEVDCYYSLINPEKPVALWDADAIKVHGITPEMLGADAQSLPAAYPDLCEFFHCSDTWIGFNNEFDRQVLWYQLLRYGKASRFPWPWKDIDVMKVAKPILNIAGKRDVKPPNLMECHTQLTGDGFASAHDALADCRATLRCLNALVEQGYI